MFQDTVLFGDEYYLKQCILDTEVAIRCKYKAIVYRMVPVSMT